MKTFRYHLSLWLATVTLFLILDFAKRVDDLLFGLSLGELATNFSLVAILVGALCLGWTLLSCLLERATSLRVVHAAVVFALITVNLWSVKVGLAHQIENVVPSTRSLCAILVLLSALLISAVIGYRSPHTWKFWEEKARSVLLGWSALVAVGLLGLLRPATTPPVQEGNKPNIVLLTIDTVSAKNTSVHGYERDTTPNLQKLAQKSIVFERFHSNFNLTGFALPSFNGYLTGTPQGQTLAQTLATNGYPNRAFFGFWAPELFFLKGFSQFEITRSGMRTSLYRGLNRVFSAKDLVWLAGLRTEEVSYFNPYNANYDDDIFWTTEHYPPEISLKSGLDYLSQHPTGSFVWIHLWPPHFPYLPDPDLKGMFGPGPDVLEPWINAPYKEDKDGYVALLKNLYDQSLFGVDRQVGKFLDGFKKAGFWDNTILIVTSDHGESFERGYLGHSGWPVMEPITHIPLLIHRPGEEQQIRVATLAQQLDLAPTILNLLGLPIPEAMRGESLVPYIASPSTLSERHKISLSLRAYTGEGGQVAIYWKTYKLMFLSNDKSVYRLYDLFQDPDAVHDISKEHPEIVQELFKHAGGFSEGP